MADPVTSAPPAHLAIYRRFRAQTFGQIVGQPAVVETLRNAVRSGRLGHGFLFVGPRGTGKTSMARILAKAVNCTDLRDGEPCDTCPSCTAIREGRALDVVELDAASNNRVDDMRELLPRVYTAASDLRRKVFIIDEVQRIKEGWDVLLKTLEEPPDGVLFVFCTTDPGQIRPAVVSRLQRFTFRPLPTADIEAKLVRILEAEGRAAEPEAVQLIARLAAGGMRDAESMLDQVLGSAGDPLTADGVRDLLGLAEGAAVDGFLDALVDGDIQGGLAVLDGLEAEGRDVVAFSEQVVAQLRARLVSTLVAGGGSAAQAAALAKAARRLTGLDASRGGVGGYRWQLELCLIAAAAERVAPDPERPTPAGRRAAAGGEAIVVPSVAAPQAPPEVAVAPGAAVDGPAARKRPRREATVADGDGEVRPANASAGHAASRPGDPDQAAPDGGPATASDRAPARAAPDELLEAVREGWPRIVAHVARNPANRPLVSACRPVEVRDGLLVLGFPEDQAFLRDIAERKRAALEDGVAVVVGRPVGVRCVVTNLELVEAPPSGSDDLVAQARRIFGDELVDVDEIG